MKDSLKWRFPISLAIPYGEKVEQSLDRIAKNVSSALLREANIDRRLASIKIAEGDPLIISMLEKLGEAKEVTAIVEEENERLELELGYDLLTAVIERRWNFISAITQKVAERNLSLKKNLSPSDKIDRIVTHKIWGLPIFLIITWFMFRFTYAVGDPIADYLDGTISALGERIDNGLRFHFCGKFCGRRRYWRCRVNCSLFSTYNGPLCLYRHS